ncbi:hypothetical protein [Deinococcus yavapaiensis]|uniref:Uncharacterized protein n=1 Tax=Deinococcus yavapaiensis KR-236 TaxID=694435 RepID=A0A318SFS3_9DEIO|nr:hypothetical protein [Deinococcus yavapaiensis]PYE52874.1 hypothetical protein DES52_11146 [Deinococcus yavapaiensis KR-236]
MLDGIFDRVKRGMDRARSRGEEMTQTTRLRLEVFGLHRELDGLYGRLGRAYHGGSDESVLLALREEIDRVDEEIAARERLIAEINARSPQAPPDEVVSASAAPSSSTTVISAFPSKEIDMNSERDNPNMTTPNTPGSNEELLRRDAERSSNLAGEERAAPPSIERNRLKDQPNQDYQERLDEGQTVSRGTLTDADLHGSSAPIPKIGSLAANDLGIDRAAVQPDTSAEAHHERIIGKNEEKQTDLASNDPSPID